MGDVVKLIIDSEDQDLRQFSFEARIRSLSIAHAPIFELAMYSALRAFHSELVVRVVANIEDLDSRKFPFDAGLRNMFIKAVPRAEVDACFFLWQSGHEIQLVGCRL